jgi:hypothetical protein
MPRKPAANAAANNYPAASHKSKADRRACGAGSTLAMIGSLSVQLIDNSRISHRQTGVTNQ